MPKPRPILKLRRKEDRGKNKKKDGKKNEARWSKGHSCESNPTVRKHRDEASNLHFQLHGVAKNSLLTVDNLESMQEDEMDEDYDVLSDDVQSLTVSDARTRLGSVSTYKTFASGWSKCSNQAFERFLARFKVDSALHKDMLSILAATTEIINSMGGKHSDTEYFATFISALESCEPSQYHPMMALVCMIIGKVSESVIRLKFKEIFSKVSTIFSTAIESNEHTLIRLCCDALGKILRTQDCIVVDPDNADNYSAYYSILKCCLHDNPKVRRKGRQVIGGLLNRHNEKRSTDLTKLVLGWILDQLVAYPTCGPKVACDTLSLLQFTWSFVESINTSASKKVFESVLRVLSGGDTNILKIGFALFTNVFQKGYGLVPENQSDDSLTPKVVCVLWDLRPDWRNNDAFIGWMRCILDGVVRLLEEGNENGQKYIPLLIEAVSPSWPSNFGQQPSQILSEYLKHIIKDDTDKSLIEDTFQLLSKNLIAIPPNPHCLTVLDSTLDTLSPSQYGNASREVLLQLVPLYSSNTSEMSRTLGRFVKAFGVENLWNSVENEAKISVILPLLRENLCQSHFKFWKENIFPLDSSDAKETMRLVVWESLIGFCRDPANVDDFPAEIVGKTVVNKPQVRLSALAAIRQFALWPQCESILKKYSKNYLPLLFNLYVKEKVNSAKEETKLENTGHADAIQLTVAEYLKFCDQEFVNDLLNRAITKLTNDKDTTEEERMPLLDLVATLVTEQLDPDVLPKLIEISSSLLVDSPNQKRGYRILFGLVKNKEFESDIKNQVLQLLRATKGKAKSNAEALRLECLLYLSETDQTLVSEFLPEAVLNLLSVNAKTRKLANRFAIQACGQLKSLEPIMGVIEVGIKSPNNFVRACTVNFMTLAFLEMKPKHPNSELIQACIDQIRENKQAGSKRMSAGADGSLCKESLGFLSLNLSLFKTLMGPHASCIGQVLALPGNPRKEVNKILARMIKVFGVAGLKAVLPNSNEPKMHARIKNLQKKIRKLKEAQGKSKKLGEDDGEDGGYDRGDKDGSASDESEDELGGSSKTSQRTLSKRGLVIKEGVIDFLDPKNVTGALISKPKEAKQGDQFKVSEDGKLIIEMEEEMVKSVTGRKRKAGLSQRSNASAFYDDEDDDEEYDKLSSKSSKTFKSFKSSNSSKRSAKQRPKKARL